MMDLPGDASAECAAIYDAIAACGNPNQTPGFPANCAAFWDSTGPDCHAALQPHLDCLAARTCEEQVDHSTCGELYPAVLVACEVPDAFLGTIQRDIGCGDYDYARAIQTIAALIEYWNAGSGACQAALVVEFDCLDSLSCADRSDGMSCLPEFSARLKACK